MAKGRIDCRRRRSCWLDGNHQSCGRRVRVDLFSLVPVKRSHSVCAQGGINGAVNTKGEGDSPWEHFDDTVYGGDFLANQPPVKAMVKRHQELFT